MKLELPKQAQEVLNIIRNAGGKGYVVGGAVRDLLLGKQPHDWDFATTLSTDEIGYAFLNSRLIGGVCGTVQVPFGKDNVCEVTPCRAESGYADVRHPDTVIFVKDIEEDLKRRDFTINAIAYDGEEIIDPFGGVEDIENKVLRCVGNPKKRFAEDALRILRLFRFMAMLQFAPDEKTLSVAVEEMSSIVILSHERVRQEIDQIIMSQCPEVLQVLIENNGLASYGLFGKADLSLLAKVPKKFSCRWWALLALCDADPEKVLTAFNFSQKFKNKLDAYTRLYQGGASASIIELKMKLRHVLVDYLPLVQTFALLNEEFVPEIALVQELRESHEPYHIEQLAINGEMLNRAGIRGKKCGFVLEELLKLVIQKPSLNQGTILIQVAEQYRELL